MIFRQMQFFALGMWWDNTYIYFCLQYDPKASLTSESNFKPLDEGITTNQFCHLDGLSIDLCQWSNQPIQENYFLENYTDIGQLMTGREYNVIEIEVIQSFVYKFRSLITDQNSYTTKWNQYIKTFHTQKKIRHLLSVMKYLNACLRSSSLITEWKILCATLQINKRHFRNLYTNISGIQLQYLDL